MINRRKLFELLLGVAAAPLIIKIVPLSTNLYSYQWILDGVPLKGETKSTFSNIPFNYKGDGLLQCEITYNQYRKFV